MIDFTQNPKVVLDIERFAELIEIEARAKVLADYVMSLEYSVPRSDILMILGRKEIAKRMIEETKKKRFIYVDR